MSSGQLQIENMYGRRATGWWPENTAVDNPMVRYSENGAPNPCLPF